MSYMLEFPPGPPLPQGIDSPPYVVFAINGTDVTPSLPPRIPLKLVLHFAPALQKWVLPAPEPAHLPPEAVRQDLQTPQIGIDVQARIETVGLVWVITCMLQRSGRTAPFNTLSLHPDLDTSLAIHDAWLALGLPRAGLDALHTHLHVQLMMRVSPVSLWDVQMIWHTFPHNSQIVRAMGINFIEGLINQEYKLETSLAILAWMRSTPELTAFLKYIQDAVPKFAEYASEEVPTAESKEMTDTGYQTVGKGASKAASKAAKAAAAQEEVMVGIMERGTTKIVSLQERRDREASDYVAMQERLRRTKSDNSLRSVDTAIEDSQQTENKGKEEASVNDDMDDPSNYSGGSFSDELTKSLEAIRLKREARRLKRSPSTKGLAEALSAVNLQQQDAENVPAVRKRDLRRRRSSSIATTGMEPDLTIAGLQGRIQVLKDKQTKLASQTRRDTDNDGREPKTQVG